MDQGVAEKRASQTGKIFQRLLPAGYTRESFAGRTAHKFDAARLAQVAEFVESMRKDYEVPGVAIGIVQDGKVVMSRGFGVRELGKPDAVDGDTRFMVDTPRMILAAPEQTMCRSAKLLIRRIQNPRRAMLQPSLGRS